MPLVTYALLLGFVLRGGKGTERPLDGQSDTRQYKFARQKLSSAQDAILLAVEMKGLRPAWLLKLWKRRRKPEPDGTKVATCELLFAHHLKRL